MSESSLVISLENQGVDVKKLLRFPSIVINGVTTEVEDARGQ